MPKPQGADSAGDVEQWLMDACAQLGLSLNGRDDDLFDAGATSLSVVRLLARADAQFGLDTLTADEVFEHGTVRGIAACIRRAMAQVETLAET